MNAFYRALALIAFVLLCGLLALYGWLVLSSGAWLG